MPGMFNLRNVLELIDDRFDDGAFAQQHHVQPRDKAVLHIILDSRDQQQATLKQLREQFLGNVSAIPEQFAKELVGQTFHWDAVIDVARGEVETQQLALLIGDQVKFEAKKPSGGSLAALGQTLHNFVTMDAQIVTNAQRRGVNEVDASAGSLAAIEITGQGHKGIWNQLDKAAVADQLWELRTQIAPHMVEVEVLESTIVGCMKEHQNGHHLTQRHATGPMAMAGSRRQLTTVADRLKMNCEVVQITKQCDDIHGGLPAVIPGLPDTQQQGLRRTGPPFLFNTLMSN